MSIIIFSRPVRSGKTTELMEYCDEIEKTKAVGGILMPDINGGRRIFDITTKEYFDIECRDPSAATRSLITVGKFFFYADVFEKANSIILETASQCDMLIIDEVGRLELEQNGFYSSIKEILQSDKFKGESKSLLLVVRDSLYEQVVAFFGIQQHDLVKSLNNI